MKNWLEQINLYLDNVCQTKVHFAADSDMDTSAFLGCFQHVVSHVESKKKPQDDAGGGGSDERKGELDSGDDMTMMLQLKDGLSEDLLLQLGKIIMHFGMYCYNFHVLFELCSVH